MLTSYSNPTATAFIITTYCNANNQLKSKWVGYLSGTAQLTENAIGRTIKVGKEFTYNNLILECIYFNEETKIHSVILVNEKEK